MVSCSAVSEIKRVGLLLDAMRRLPGLGHDSAVRWVHFGDGALMPALREAAAELPAGLTVELPGHTPNDEVLGFYAANRVDVFVNVEFDRGRSGEHHGGDRETTSGRRDRGRRHPRDRSRRRWAPARSSKPYAAPEAIARVIRAVLDAPDEAYSPRALWAGEYDARVTGARAAELVRSLLPR